MLTDALNDKINPILETLEEAPLSEEETQQALQDKINEFNTPSFEYNDIEFDDDDGMTSDMLIARQMIMETLDKSKKISDLVFENLIVDSSNPTFLTLAQEANKTIQQSVTNLTKLHDMYHKIKNQKKKNDILDGVETPKEDDSKFKFGSAQELI